MNKYIYIVQKKQKNAFAHKKTIVAIETEWNVEGLPYRENEKMAIKVTESVRDVGAISAYIFIIDGRVKVEMSEDEIDKYANTIIFRAKKLNFALIFYKVYWFMI